MIVVGTKKYISSVDSLQKGHKYSIDSKMGGSFTLTYLGVKYNDGSSVKLHYFKNESEEFSPLTPFFSISEFDLCRTIYCVVPENSYECKIHMQEKLSRGVHADHEWNCTACIRNATIKIEFSGPDVDYIDVLFHPKYNSRPLGIEVRSNSAPFDHPVRSSLPKLCGEISLNSKNQVLWTLSEDRRKWTCNDASLAYAVICQMGFQAHKEEAEWIETGKWPESEFTVMVNGKIFKVKAETYEQAEEIAAKKK